MAATLTLQRTAFIAFCGTAAITLLPRRTVYAEAPPKDELPDRKPIYSRQPTTFTPEPSSTSPVSQPNPTNPTPTDRLTTQIAHARLFLHSQSLRAETTFNSLLTWAFAKETSFTNTLASLAPSPETGEQLLPGAIYVLVATMAGSIVSRNRNVVVRATFPAAVGITAGWMLIPVTMRNTANLLWEYEKKAPAVAETHLQVRQAAVQAWNAARDQAEAARRWADSTATQSRARVESFVEKGK